MNQIQVTFEALIPNIIFCFLFIVMLLDFWGINDLSPVSVDVSKIDLSLTNTNSNLGLTSFYDRNDLFLTKNSFINGNFDTSLQAFKALPNAKKQFRFFSLIFILILLALELINRWLKSGYPPLSNLYESLLFLTWCLTFGNLIYNKSVNPPFNISHSGAQERNSDVHSNPNFEQRLESKENITKSNNFNFGIKNEHKQNLNTSNIIVNLLTSPTALFIFTAASWLLPKEMQEIRPLVPALKSNWLLMHVSIILLSYSALLIGSLFSIAYLGSFWFLKIKFRMQASPKLDESSISESQNVKLNNIWSNEENSENPNKNKNLTFARRLRHSSDIESFEILQNCDKLSSQCLTFAFPMLTLGILSGAVWANDAWGSYWSWDPKETWALITWFIYAAYIHTRFSKGWRGEASAYLATLGGVSVWVCYLGVNIAAKGLHSYGWVMNT